MTGRRRGFTLVEILIVVIILAVLAAIVIPVLSDVVTSGRETNLKENLSKFRVHIQLYREQHNRYPDGDALADQMTMYTNTAGETQSSRDGDHRFGPYLEQMPANPFTGQRTVAGTDDASELFPAGDEDGGWWYNETTGRFYADLTDAHVDGDGNPYNRY